MLTHQGQLLVFSTCSAIAAILLCVAVRSESNFALSKTRFKVGNASGGTCAIREADKAYGSVGTSAGGNSENTPVIAVTKPLYCDAVNEVFVYIAVKTCQKVG